MSCSQEERKSPLMKMAPVPPKSTMPDSAPLGWPSFRAQRRILLSPLRSYKGSGGVRAEIATAIAALN